MASANDCRRFSGTAAGTCLSADWLSRQLCCTAAMGGERRTGNDAGKRECCGHAQPCRGSCIAGAHAHQFSCGAALVSSAHSPSDGACAACVAARGRRCHGSMAALARHARHLRVIGQGCGDSLKLALLQPQNLGRAAWLRLATLVDRCQILPGDLSDPRDGHGQSTQRLVIAHLQLQQGAQVLDHPFEGYRAGCQ